MLDLASTLHPPCSFTPGSLRVPTNLIVKFVDDTTVLRLINNDNKSAYRNVVQHLASWCKNHN